MKLLYYKYPKEEEESVLVSDFLLSRESSVALLISPEDVDEKNMLYFMESDGATVSIEETQNDYTFEDVYFVNYGGASFEAVLPFASVQAAKDFSLVLQDKMSALEALWDEEYGDDTGAGTAEDDEEEVSNEE